MLTESNPPIITTKNNVHPDNFIVCADDVNGTLGVAVGVGPDFAVVLQLVEL